MADNLVIHGWFSKLHYWIVTALDVIKWLVLLKAGSKLHPFHCTALPVVKSVVVLHNKK